MIYPYTNIYIINHPILIHRNDGIMDNLKMLTFSRLLIYHCIGSYLRKRISIILQLQRSTLRRSSQIIPYNKTVYKLNIQLELYILSIRIINSQPITARL